MKARHQTIKKPTKLLKKTLLPPPKMEDTVLKELLIAEVVSDEPY